MKKNLIVVVVLLCMASVMAAMAYNKAYVHNPTSLEIVSSDEALLAVIPGEGLGNKDATASIDDYGRMRIDFGKGIGGEMFGLQPGSGYTWNKLFSIKNNSEEDLTYRITMDGAEIMKHITIYDNRDGRVVSDQKNLSPYVKIASGEEVSFKVHMWQHPTDSPLGKYTGTIQINTEAKEYDTSVTGS